MSNENTSNLEDTLIMFPASKNYPVADEAKQNDVMVESHSDPLEDLLNEFEEVQDEAIEDLNQAIKVMSIDELEDMDSTELIAHMEDQIDQIQECQKRIKYYIDDLENYN